MEDEGHSWLKIVIIALLLAALAGAGTSYYLYQQYQQTKSELESATMQESGDAQEQTRQVVEAVGKLVVLPQGEDPVLATIVDKTQVQDQPFFASAENGDQVLVYTKAKKAYLYRPSINKLLDIGPVSGELPSASESAQPTQN